jgi:hypothetical protein
MDPHIPVATSSPVCSPAAIAGSNQTDYDDRIHRHASNRWNGVNQFDRVYRMS